MSSPAAALAGQIERIIHNRISGGTLVVPAMPEVAQECLSALKDPDFAVKKVVSILERDPVAAAHVMAAANAAIYGGASVRSLSQAATRVGAQKLRTVLLEYAARELFTSPNPRIRAALRGVWDHSLAVALLARDLGAVVNAEDPDICYLAGLLHDVGKPVVASMLLETERSLGVKASEMITPEMWADTVARVHRSVGAALAAKWHLPADVIEAIADLGEYDSTNRNSPANMVRFANAVAKREGFVSGPVDADEIDALIMIGRSMLKVDDEVVARLARGLGEQVAASSFAPR
jgi:putative nucleotidyltransferase with HDIG domain